MKACFGPVRANLRSSAWSGQRQDRGSDAAVSYSGICGSELSGYLGQNSLRKPPLVMGHEFTGKSLHWETDWMFDTQGCTRATSWR